MYIHFSTARTISIVRNCTERTFFSTERTTLCYGADFFLLQSGLLFCVKQWSFLVFLFQIIFLDIFLIRILVFVLLLTLLYQKFTVRSVLKKSPLSTERKMNLVLEQVPSSCAQTPTTHLTAPPPPHFALKQLATHPYLM